MLPVRKTAGFQLSAYLVCRQDLTIGELRAYLGGKLPQAMIPAECFLLDRFPLTASGKIDRTALIGLELKTLDTGVAYEPPTTPLELTLASIWEEVLGVDRLGVGDNFFDHGGDSYKAIRLIGRVSRQLKRDALLQDLFRFPTIREYAAYWSAGIEGADEFRRLGFYRINNQYPQHYTLICLPPLIGFSFNFHRMKEIIQHPIYLFNMLVESMDGDELADNRALIAEYVRQVKLIDRQGPLVLVGWSAGGKLAFEVCQALEADGIEVHKMIMVDVNRKVHPLPEKYIQHQLSLLRRRLKRINTAPPEIENSQRRMRRYYDFYLTVEHGGAVNADIEMIASKYLNLADHKETPNLLTEETAGEIGSKYWADMTTGGFRIHEGFGKHADMFNADYIELNAGVIKRLLAEAGKPGYPEDILAGHRDLSQTSVDYLDFVAENPDSLERAHYDNIQWSDEATVFQPWPTFIDRDMEGRMKHAAESVLALVKSIPQRFFDSDPEKMSRYYRTSTDMVKYFLYGVDDLHIADMLARGDWVVSPQGLKILEYNVATNTAGWESDLYQLMYLESPPTRRFVQEHHVNFQKSAFVRSLVRHMIDAVQRRFKNHEPINIAVVVPQYDPQAPTSLRENHVAATFAAVLKEDYPGLAGSVVFCDFPHLDVKDGRVYLGEKRIHAVHESSGGIVPMEIVGSFAQNNVCLFNGPATWIFSNKSNLALLSTHRESDLFTDEEREIIDRYIPWTRLIEDHLQEFVLSHKDRLVIKPNIGYGGKETYIGANTDDREWGELIRKALETGDWIAQEYVESHSYWYQTGERGGARHHAVWGLFVFGRRFAGSWVRVLPQEHSRGVINCSRGAAEGVVLVVEE